MGRIARTIFNPSLGIKYIVEDRNGNEIVGRTLGPKDKEHIPIRSSITTPKGQEFFKMLIGGKVYKFLNSIKLNDCLSDDGKFIFTGRRPNGKTLLPSNKKKIETVQDDLEFVSDLLSEMLSGIWTNMKKI